MPSPRRKRSRSRSKDEFKYPANSSKELKALLLQYMHTEKFNCPLDSITLMRNLRMQFKNPSGRTMMKSYNINDLLVELEDKKAVKLESFSLGANKCYMIMSYSREIVQQLSRETYKDRPKKFPTMITDINEKFPWYTPCKSIPNDYLYKGYKSDATTFCIKGTIKDIRNSDLILLNLIENKQSGAKIFDTKGDEWQSQGILIFRDVNTEQYTSLLEKWGYCIVGTINVFKVRKSFMKRNLWTSISNEQLLIGSKQTNVEIPELIESETEQDLYRDILKTFNSVKPVEVFSKLGKDNWVIVETLT